MIIISLDCAHLLVIAAVQEERGPRKNKGQRLVSDGNKTVVTSSASVLHMAPPRNARSPLQLPPPPGMMPYCPWVATPRYDLPPLLPVNSHPIGLGDHPRGPVPSEVPIGSRGRSAFMKVIPGSTKSKVLKEEGRNTEGSHRKCNAKMLIYD